MRGVIIGAMPVSVVVMVFVIVVIVLRQFGAG